MLIRPPRKQARSLNGRGRLLRCRRHPLFDRAGRPTLETGRPGETRPAMRARRPALKGVKRLPATSAESVFTGRRRDLAGGASKTFAPRSPGKARQRQSLLQASPTIDQNKNRNGPIPDGARPIGIKKKSRHSNHPDDGSHHQTSGPPHPEPQQRTQDLASIQGINRQQIEDEQNPINEGERLQKGFGRRARTVPIRRPSSSSPGPAGPASRRR